MTMSCFKIVSNSISRKYNFFKLRKLVNFKMESAEIWILTCLSFVVTFKKIRCQIKNRVCLLMHLGASGFILSNFILT